MIRQRASTARSGEKLRVTRDPFPASSPLVVLVVEDEPLIRMMVCEDLQEHGFQVVEAGDAGAALAVLEQDPSIALVFTDIRMPGPMDGEGLARWVRSHRPEVRVILTSGHVQPTEARQLAQLGPFLPKPFRLTTLLEAIQGP